MFVPGYSELFGDFSFSIGDYCQDRENGDLIYITRIEWNYVYFDALNGDCIGTGWCFRTERFSDAFEKVEMNGWLGCDSAHNGRIQASVYC